MKRWPWVVSRDSSFMPPCRRLFVEQRGWVPGKVDRQCPGELQTAVHSSLSTPAVVDSYLFSIRTPTQRARQLPHDPIRTRSELRDETLSSRITRSPQAPRRSVAASQRKGMTRPSVPPKPLVLAAPKDGSDLIDRLVRLLRFGARLAPRRAANGTPRHLPTYLGTVSSSARVTVRVQAPPSTMPIWIGNYQVPCRTCGPRGRDPFTCEGRSNSVSAATALTLGFHRSHPLHKTARQEATEKNPISIARPIHACDQWRNRLDATPTPFRQAPCPRARPLRPRLGRVMNHPLQRRRCSRVLGLCDETLALLRASDRAPSPQRRICATAPAPGHTYRASENPT